MILVKFSGGIGNQLFQYAMYQNLRDKYPNTEVYADLSEYVLNDVHNGFELDSVFDLKYAIKKATWHEVWKAKGELFVPTNNGIGKYFERPMAWINARTRHMKMIWNRVEYVEEEPFHANENYELKQKRRRQCAIKLKNLEDKKNYYIDGYWQDEQYYEEELKSISESLVFKNLKEHPDEQRLGTEMHNQNSLSLHLRFGDYSNSDYDVLTNEYYLHAIHDMKQRTTIDVIYAFSDDLLKAKNVLKGVDGIVFVEGHVGKDDWLDLYLMSCCNHHILANSSFSTWAAYLGQGEETVVIYPSKYTKQDENLIRGNWVRMEVK